MNYYQNFKNHRIAEVVSRQGPVALVSCVISLIYSGKLVL